MYLFTIQLLCHKIKDIICQQRNIINVTRLGPALQEKNVYYQGCPRTCQNQPTRCRRPNSTELTTPAVGDGFHSPKPKINGSEIGSPPLKSKKPDPTDPSFSKQVLRFFWVDPASFEFSLGRFKLDSVRFHQIQPRSCQKWLRSRWIWRDLAGFLPFFKIFSSDSAIFHIFLAGFSPFSK